MALSRRQFLRSASLFSLTGSIPTLTSRAVAGPSVFAITGTVVSGSAPPRTAHAVIVNGTTISDVIPAHSLPADVPVLASNGCILPGIINAHVHRCHSQEQRAEQFLRHGVTAIGDTASPLATLPALLDTFTPTATAACAGPMLCAPGGYPTPVHGDGYALPVTSPRQAREAVNRLHDLGATMIKLAFEPGPYAKPWPLLDASTAAAACDRARALNMTVRCHVEDLSGLRPALQAGVHTIEHVPTAGWPMARTARLPKKVQGTGNLSEHTATCWIR